MARPRSVLLGVIVFIGVGLFAFAVAPWVLPVRILEGPLVQQSDETSAILIWYISRPAECELVVEAGANTERRLIAESDGKRQRVRIDRLPADSQIAYRVECEGRVLGRYKLRTNRPADQAFTFIVFGDSGKATAAQYILAGRMIEAGPDFLLHTGDLVYPSGQRSGFNGRFFVPYRKLLSNVSFWPCLGNHDVSPPNDGAPYREVFELPDNGPTGLPAEHNYWFDYGAARIAVIDSNLNAELLRDVVAPWLREVLSDESLRWRFVAMHHPPYSVGPHGRGGKLAPIRDALVPAFESAGVDVVFAGHDHLYERTHPMLSGAVVEQGRSGVVYVVTGAGGAALYDASPPDERANWFAAVDDEHHSFTKVTVADELLTLEQVGRDGESIDRWTWSKPRPHAGSANTNKPSGADKTP